MTDAPPTAFGHPHPEGEEPNLLPVCASGEEGKHLGEPPETRHIPGPPETRHLRGPGGTKKRKRRREKDGLA